MAESMNDLGNLGGTNSFAHAASADGSVIVGRSNTVSSIDNAFKYSNGAMISLGTLGGTRSRAYGISADGSVIVGESYYTGGGLNYHAFKYSNGTMTDLGTLGGTTSTAYGVSADGKVIVASPLTLAVNTAPLFTVLGLTAV